MKVDGSDQESNEKEREAKPMGTGRAWTVLRNTTIQTVDDGEDFGAKGALGIHCKGWFLGLDSGIEAGAMALRRRRGTFVTIRAVVRLLGVLIGIFIFALAIVVGSSLLDGGLHLNNGTCGVPRPVGILAAVGQR